MITRTLFYVACVMPVMIAWAVAQSPESPSAIPNLSNQLLPAGTLDAGGFANAQGLPETRPRPSQSSPMQPAAGFLPPGTYGYSPYAPPNHQGWMGGSAPTEEELKLTQEFSSAVTQLRNAKTTEDKAEARKKLGELLEAQLERDLKQRETKLAMIEQRAKELREQLEQRRSSKTDIQKMLMLLIENPQSGLGLPPTWMNTLIPQPAIAPGSVYAPGYPTTSPALPQQNSSNRNSPKPLSKS